MRDMQRMLNEMFGQVQSNFMADEAARAKANPTAHKLSRVMEGNRGLNYRYHDAGKDGRGRKIWFCRSTGRNVAGYFLAWRQVETPAKKKATKAGDLVSTIERDRWLASRSKKRVQAVCRKRAEAVKAARARRSAAKS